MDNSPPLMFVIGDSISIYYGPHLQRMLQGRLAYARKTGQEPAIKHCRQENHTDNGLDSASVLEYVQAMAGDPNWRMAVLLLNCGLHDIKGPPGGGALLVPLDSYKANLRKIVEIMQARAGRIAWVRSTPVDDEQHRLKCQAFTRKDADVRTYNAAADEIMAGAGIATIDLYGFTAGLGQGIYADHAHFTDNVSRLQAAYIAGFVEGMCSPTLQHTAR